MLEAVVNYSTNTHLFVYVCVLLGNHFVATTTVSEELHCLAEECFYLKSLHLICFVLVCETLLRIWNNGFIKAISPVVYLLRGPLAVINAL